MDFKKFGIVILVLGLIILAYGGFQFKANQPKRFNPAESGRSIFGGRDDIGNYLNVHMTNITRASKRQDAKRAMIIGGIVAFLGGGIMVSAQKKTHG